MGGKVISGQQGQKNDSSASKVVKTTGNGNFTLRDEIDQLEAAFDGTITLPPNPAVGQSHVILALAGTAAVVVQGGANPLFGGPYTLADGDSLCVTFTSAGRWMPECGSGTGSAASNARAFDRIVSSTTTNQETFVQLLTSTPLAVTGGVGKKLYIWVAYSFAHSPPGEEDPPEFTTRFRLVINDGSGDTILDQTTENTDVTIFQQSGAIAWAFPFAGDLAPGTYTVRVDWATDGGVATIDPVIAGNGAQLVVREM